MLDSAAYDAIDAINFSRLKTLRKSAKHFRHECDRRAAAADEADVALHFRVGRLCHAMLLEPQTVPERFIRFDGDRRQKKIWTAFQKEHAGKVILTPPEWKRATGIALAVSTHPIAADLIGVGLKESVITWTDSETGVACKGRPDIAGRYLVDLKHTSFIDPRLFARQVVNLGYHLQLAMYLDGLLANGIRVEHEPMLVAVEAVEPHDVVVYRFEAPEIDIARNEYRALLRTYQRCREADRWPGISDSVITFALPAWAYPDESTELTFGGEAMY
jgi:hypothetical protein